MYIIKIFSDFANSAKCKEVYENICNTSKMIDYGENKKIVITDGENYTHAIIMNTCMPTLHIPKENVIGLAFEPYEFLRIKHNFIDYAKTHISKYYIGDKRDLPEPFIEHFGYMWYSTPHKSLEDKQYIMSICVSEKRSAPGHMYRHTLIEKIIQYNLPIDIYGRGSVKYKYYKHSKGEFKDVEPYEKYLFSICIENYQNNDYISEKFITPLLYNCMPLYSGCKNIKKYFDDDNMILLTNHAEQDINLIISILTNPQRYYKKTYTEKNIKTVNFIENVERLFG